MHNYIKNLRKLIGHRKFIHPAARIIVENEQEQILVIKRVDNGKWGIPAGGLEEKESIEECIIREVKEETGLEILELQVVGISTKPDLETVYYPNKDVVQYFTIEFYSNQWQGEIEVEDTEEVQLATFKDKSIIEQLPDLEQNTFVSLAYFRKTGQIRLA